MSELDDILQDKLSALESGAPLEEILDGSEGHGDAANVSELNALVRLAAAVRSLPHPQPQAESVQADRGRLAVARQQTWPVSGRKSAKGISQRTQNRSRWFGWTWAGGPVLAAGLVVCLVFFMAAMGGLGYWLGGPRQAKLATIMDVRGGVEVGANQAGSSWKNLNNGDHVRTGERIRTHAASAVTLVFYDGSRTTLGPDSDVTLQQVDGGWGGVLKVALQVNAGKTSNSVVPLQGSKSSFVVYTPSGSATVHGTSFNVAYDFGRELARYSVNTGKVLVNSAGSQLFLAAGQAVTAFPGRTLQAADYQFAVQGKLSTQAAGQWLVGGVAFSVSQDTSMVGKFAALEPQAGDRLYVEGRILADGNWMADEVAPAQTDGPAFSFTGIVESMEADTWLVGGMAVVVRDRSQVGEGVELGSPVRVSFSKIKDGRWLAEEIELLEETPEEPTPTPSATPDPDAQPVLVFDPTSLEISTCEPEINQDGNLANIATQEGDLAANVELGYQIEAGADYVADVSLVPDGWDSLAPGEQQSFAIHIGFNELWAGTPSGTEVRLRIFVANETNNPAAHVSELTLSVISTCGGTPTETPTPTATDPFTETPTPTDTPVPSETPTPSGTPGPSETPTPTGTPFGTPTATPTPSATPDFCTGASPHPKGMQLAQKFGVPYEEIMGWFCQHYGFGEIDLAYSLSLEHGVAVEEIFAMRASGMGWGQIKKALENRPAATGTPGPGDPGNGNPGNGNNGGGNGNGNGGRPPSPPGQDDGKGKKK